MTFIYWMLCNKWGDNRRINVKSIIRTVKKHLDTMYINRIEIIYRMALKTVEFRTAYNKLAHELQKVTPPSEWINVFNTGVWHVLIIAEGSQLYVAQVNVGITHILWYCCILLTCVLDTRWTRGNSELWLDESVQLWDVHFGWFWNSSVSASQSSSIMVDSNLIFVLIFVLIFP